MGLFSKNKKISKDKLKRAINDVINFAESDDQTENILLLQGHACEEHGFHLTEGVVSCKIENIAKMLVEFAKQDENFAKCVVTAGKGVENFVPGMKDFGAKLDKAADDAKSNNLPDGVKSAIHSKLKERFPDAEIVSLDITKIDEMDDDKFNDIVDKIYKASQRNARNGDKE